MRDRASARRVSRDPVTGVQIRIGVMGAASEPPDPAVAALCRRLGRSVAERGACLLTGACPGLPHESVRGAKEIGRHVVGISPAASLRDRVDVFGSPYREYDNDPTRLIDQLLARYQTPGYVCPCWPSSADREKG